jgi:hypothetical protein
MQKRKPRDINEEEFFGFAKSYLSEAFPNPQWIDCPPDCELTRLAERPREAHPFVSQHLKLLFPPALIGTWKFSPT